MPPNGSRQYTTEIERLAALETRLASTDSDIKEIFHKLSKSEQVQVEHTIRLANIEEKLDGIHKEITSSIERVFASFQANKEPEKPVLTFLSKENLKLVKSAFYLIFTAAGALWGYLEFIGFIKK